MNRYPAKHGQELSLITRFRRISTHKSRCLFQHPQAFVLMIRVNERYGMFRQQRGAPASRVRTDRPKTSAGRQLYSSLPAELHAGTLEVLTVLLKYGFEVQSIPHH